MCFLLKTVMGITNIYIKEHFWPESCHLHVNLYAPSSLSLAPNTCTQLESGINLLLKMHQCCTQSFHRLARSPSKGWHVQSVQPSSTQARPLRSKRHRMGAEWWTGGSLAGCLGKIWETPSHCQNKLRHRPAIISLREGAESGSETLKS